MIHVLWSPVLIYATSKSPCNWEAENFKNIISISINKWMNIVSEPGCQTFSCDNWQIYWCFYWKVLVLTLKIRNSTNWTFADCVDQDQTAQNVQSELDIHCPIRWFFSSKNKNIRVVTIALKVVFPQVFYQDEGPNLSTEHGISNNREQGIGMLQAKWTVRQVAAFFRCTKPTIYSLIRGHQITGTSENRRSGRPRVTSAAEDRCIRLTTIPIGL